MPEKFSCRRLLDGTKVQFVHSHNSKLPFVNFLYILSRYIFTLNFIEEHRLLWIKKFRMLKRDCVMLVINMCGTLRHSANRQGKSPIGSKVNGMEQFACGNLKSFLCPCPTWTQNIESL